jgi:hypothetical protein
VASEAGGWVASPDDPGAVAEALAQALGSVAADRARPWGDLDAVRRYEAGTVAAQLDEVIRELARGG